MQDQLRQKGRSLLKKKQQNTKARDVVQIKERLPSKHKALN
jgi:hypothetical protein